ncbi:hypothetical protein C1645_838169 [Glomus cerebriforme]|uniref:HCP-like protein n=1 Tax=Glomus cerebriforme TaxID=658196 RepID=A0A397S7M0_9GLOM|nr:hypothetical protein C1645_838169 [Glomus cerebriforme]
MSSNEYIDNITNNCELETEIGNEIAMNSLAIHYYNGEGTEKNLEKAFYWCQEAAENDNKSAMNNLANSYYNGEGTEKNLEKAFYWYRKAAEIGDKNAMYNLAICHYDGEGTEKKLEKAFYWFQKSAEIGDKTAMNNLATRYYNGEGTEKNLEKAFYWYQKAAENAKQEFSDAQDSLGYFYKNGIGTERDLEKAIYWYQKAAKNEKEIAKFNLDTGKYYQYGTGVVIDKFKPFELYEKNNKVDFNIFERLKAEESQQMEGKKDNTKNNEIITPKKTNDADIAYNRIYIDNINKTKCIVASDFFTVDTSINYGISANMHDKVEELYDLLNNKKDEIDYVLKSQPVYAIGPNFHKDYSFPCIVCWVTSDLETSILEQLEKIFDYKFKARNNINGNGYNSNGQNGGSQNDVSDGNNNGNEDGDGNGNVDSDEDGNGNNVGDGDGDSDGNGDGYISVSSVAHAGTEDQSNIQGFSIRINLHAKFIEVYKGFPKFSVNVDVVECGTNGMLSNNWSQLAEEGYGYFLESLKIEIIPIANVPNNKTELIWQEYLFPEEKNNSIEHINNTEKQANFEISATPKAGVQIKQASSTKNTSDEWELQVAGTGVTGYIRKCVDSISQLLRHYASN